MSARFDFILVGGGLQAGLLALALDHYQPDANVLLLERDPKLFGNHTWSFHLGDVVDQMDWLEFLPRHTWPSYTVRFPGLEQQVDLAYCSTNSDHFTSVIKKLIRDGRKLEVRTDVEVSTCTDASVTLADGSLLEAKAVIDCRGRQRRSTAGGFQKFFGLELELEVDWSAKMPVLMDASVEQQDGYRFLYVLPFSRRRVLIEDTFFSNSPILNVADSRREIESYLYRNSVYQWKVVREEQGCLPMPYTMELTPGTGNHLSGGFAGGWFHAATGYSFPLAARFASAVADGPVETFRQRVKQLASKNYFQSKFSRFLNRLLFRLVLPEKRFEIFRRFYKVLPEETIQRFYSHTFTVPDATRILVGSPPSGLTPIRFVQSYFEAKPCQL